MILGFYAAAPHNVVSFLLVFPGENHKNSGVIQTNIMQFVLYRKQCDEKLSTVPGEKTGKMRAEQPLLLILNVYKLHQCRREVPKNTAK